MLFKTDVLKNISVLTGKHMLESLINEVAGFQAIRNSYTGVFL